MESSAHRPAAAGPRPSRSRATVGQPSFPTAGLAIATFLVILIAIAFRVPRLADSPGWDADEAYNLDIAWHRTLCSGPPCSGRMRAAAAPMICGVCPMQMRRN